MVKRGIVIATDSNMATIEEINGTFCFECMNKGSNGNCLHCAKRSECNTERIIAANTIKAEIGDTVEYSKKILSNFMFSLISFVLPILLTVITYVILSAISSDDPMNGRISLCVLSALMIIAAIYSYKLSKIRCDYKIISKV
jgi:positive regulator of sigma E activity